MKLLIVDDNAQMRLLIKSFVDDIAESVIECSDGSEALTAYREQLPDWVLMDIKMGQEDGISATRQIKAAYPAARIMIVTDYNDSRLRRAARCAGACEYVVKEDLREARRILLKGF
jgi:two-component system, chemotaxis family, chemotaxis protein CheY